MDTEAEEVDSGAAGFAGGLSGEASIPGAQRQGTRGTHFIYEKRTFLQRHPGHPPAEWAGELSSDHKTI